MEQLNNNLKNYLTKFIKVKENSAFSISDPLGLKLLAHLKINFSHHNEHKFRHNFKYTVHPMCSCGAGMETTDHLRCQNFAVVRSSFLNRIFEINVEFRNMNDLTLTSLLLFGSDKQTFDFNTKVLNLTI